MQPLYKMFPQLEPALLEEIEANAIVKTIPADEVLIRTGQYIKSALLVIEGTLKIFRENDEGAEFLMYYLQPGEACAISLVCASKMEASKVMVKSVEESINIVHDLGQSTASGGVGVWNRQKRHFQQRPKPRTGLRHQVIYGLSGGSVGNVA